MKKWSVKEKYERGMIGFSGFREAEIEWYTNRDIGESAREYLGLTDIEFMIYNTNFKLFEVMVKLNSGSFGDGELLEDELGWLLVELGYEGEYQYKQVADYLCNKLMQMGMVEQLVVCEAMVGSLRGVTSGVAKLKESSELSVLDKILADNLLSLIDLSWIDKDVTLTNKCIKHLYSISKNKSTLDMLVVGRYKVEDVVAEIHDNVCTGFNSMSIEIYKEYGLEVFKKHIEEIVHYVNVPYNSFKSLYLSGEADMSSIHDYIEDWSSSMRRVCLASYLGLTGDELYILLMDGENALKAHLDSLRGMEK